jgi:hypothetical protein
VPCDDAAVTQEPSATFEATYESGTDGLVGQLAVAIHDADGNVVVGPQTTDIVELNVGGQPTGTYSAVLIAPATVGQYVILWSNDGTFDPQAGGAAEDLEVEVAILGLSPLPPLEDGGAGMGPPCSAWTSRAAVASCCEGFSDATTDSQDAAIRAASEILWEVSNHLYPGECGPVTVRPCNQGCGCWNHWASGMEYSWDPIRSRWMCDTHVCGCSPTSEVVLAGVPIREITEVLIDGVALDTDEYALIEPNVLVRLRDVIEPNSRNVWPGCQIMDLPETEEGTFAITYTYGADPPQAGRNAAAVLACEIWKACREQECALPSGVTRVERQGITIETPSLAAKALVSGMTGITAIDAFIAPFSGHVSGLRSSVWSPDLDYPRRYRAASGT